MIAILAKASAAHTHTSSQDVRFGFFLMAEFDRQLAAEVQPDTAGQSNAAHLHLSPMH